MDAEGAGTAGCVTAEIRLLAEVGASGRTARAGRGPPPALSPSVRCRRHPHPVRQLQLLLLPPRRACNGLARVHTRIDTGVGLVGNVGNEGICAGQRLFFTSH